MSAWYPAERALLRKLRTPAHIQDFLDELPYCSDDDYRSPRFVMKHRQGDCGDAALFAAAALSELGYPPQLVHLAAVRDDDHLITVFHGGRGWGAVSKSNTVGLRFREPIHRSLHELIVSYFEWYYNLEAEKTLRSYSRPFRLVRFDHLNWRTEETHLPRIMKGLDDLPHIRLLDPAAARRLRPVDQRCFRGGLVGARHSKLYGFRKGMKI